VTLEEHARAIAAAIQAAADDGFYVDDTDGVTPELDLNDWGDGFTACVRVNVPKF
jgi:hypothetical protein